MLCLFGPPAVSAGGSYERLALRPKEWALVARLAIAGEPLPRAALARLLFPEAEDPRRALRWHLADLRKKLPAGLRDRLVVDRHTAGLEAPTDVATFAAGSARLLADPADPRAAETLSLYRDDLCAGLAVSASQEFDTWLYVEQERLRRLFRRGVVTHARRAATTGVHAAALAPLSRLLTVDPYFEEAHLLLIQAYEALGRADAARSAYEVYQRTVRQELQAEPRPELAARFEGRRPAARPLPDEDLVPLRDVTLHVVDWPGEEPAVLGIHGSAGSAYSLTALGERLAPSHRFVAVDLRGHGFSDKPPAGYDLATHVEDVSQLVGVLGLEGAVMLGFSLGGPVAAAVAARYGAGGLILLDAAIGDRAFLARRGAESVVPTEGTLDLKFTGVDEYLRHWRAATPRYSDEAERWLDRFARYELARLPDGTYRRRGLRAALRAEFESVLEEDTLDLLAQARCPTLLVRGGQSWMGGLPWLTDEMWEAQRRACPSATTLVAASSNHASLVRDPSHELVAAISAFLVSDVRAAAGPTQTVSQTGAPAYSSRYDD
jgi:pimeloyl-ACP methyl ester carboxylesterase/DNA-binding SARP family transcriptional activator